MRELEFSKITLRLVDKENAKDGSEDNTVAKLTGDTYSTLQRILVHFPFFPFSFFFFFCSRPYYLFALKFFAYCFFAVHSDGTGTSLGQWRCPQGCGQRKIYPRAHETGPIGEYQQHG